MNRFLNSAQWTVVSKRIRILLAFTIALSTVLCPLSTEAAGPGTTTGELLKIPVGARAIGMGEAYTAAADDSSALQWNPAGLSLAEQKEVSFMHSSLIEGIHYEHLAFSAPGEGYSFGTSLSYLGYGDIAGYDDVGTSIGDQSAYGLALNAGLATVLKDRLSLGGAVTMLRQKLADESAGTFAGNFGAIYSAQRKVLSAQWRFGFSILNLGPGLKFVSERDPLPRKIKFGVAANGVKAWPLNLTMDVTKPNDNDTYIGIGSEYWFRELIALRLGYAGSNDEGRGLRMGIGLKLREFLFDYAYGGFGDFGATHRIGISLRFGDKIKQLNKEERAILKEARVAKDQGDYVQAILNMEEVLEKNPNDDRVLKQMISTHEAMLKHELNEAVASANTKEEIPSPEEFALQDLVPGQQMLVQGALPAKSMTGFNPADPLGLEKLPDATTMEVPTTEQLLAQPMPGAAAPTPALEQKSAPAEAQAVPESRPVVAEPVQDTPVVAEPASSSGASSSAANDTPLLNPADFQ